MTIVDILKNPILLLGIIIFITLVLYFVISKTSSSSRPTCTKNQEIINDKCVEKCPNNGPRCPPNTGQCIEFGYKCDSDGNYCNDYQYCGAKCCPADQHCDKSNPNAQNCVKCPNKTCDGNCCPNKTDVCADTGNTTCCNPKNIGTDQYGKITNICCTEELCDGICCDSANGFSCAPDPTDSTKKKCMLQCPNKNTINDDIFKCDDGKSPKMPTNPLTCTEDQFCFRDCDDNTFSCVDNDKCWGNVRYNPPLLTYRDDSGIKNYLYGKNNNTVSLACNINKSTNDCDEKSDKWLINKPGLSSNIIVELSNNAYSSKNCNANTCEKKIEQVNTSAGTYNQQTLNNNGKCIGQLNNSSLLLASDASTICKDFDTNTNNNRNVGRCCKDKDSEGNPIYTGQICDVDNKCFKNSTGIYECIDPYTYCGNNGTWNSDLIKCDCKYGYSGNNCKTVLKWDEFYNDDWVKAFANPRIIRTDGGGWDTFLVIVVNGDDDFIHKIKQIDIDEYKFKRTGSDKETLKYNVEHDTYGEGFYTEFDKTVAVDDNIGFTYVNGLIGGKITFLVDGNSVGIKFCKNDAYSVCLDTKNSTLLSSTYWKFYPFWSKGLLRPVNVLIAAQYEYMDKRKNTTPLGGIVLGGDPLNNCANVTSCDV
jgi:hypothetical protein